jgi:O-antigen/teichoic acid export membrane protein
MSGEIKSITKHSTIYMLGNVLNRLVAFIMLPFYTNYLIPAEYGVIEILSLTIDLVITFASLGMIETITKFYSHYKSDEQKKLVVSSAFIGMMSIISVLIIICFLLTNQITSFLFNSEEYISYTRITFIAMFFGSAIGVPLLYLRIKLKSTHFILINSIKLFINLALNIYFLVYAHMGVMGVLYGTLITNILISIYLIIVMIKDTGFKFRFHIYKDMIKFGAPLIISSLSMWFITYADRYFLTRYSNLNEVGIYSLAYKLGALVTILGVAPFQSVWSVMYFDIAKKEKGEETFIKILNYFLIFSMTLSLSVSILSYDLLRIMSNESYWAAYMIVPFITISYVCFGSNSITNAGILIKNKTKYNAFSTILALLINMIFNYLLIPKLGGMGAGLATLFAFFTRLCMDTFFSQRLYLIHYEWKKIIIILLINILLMIIGLFLKIENIFISISINLLIITIFPLSLFIFNILSIEEKKNIVSIIKNIFRKISFNT